MNRVILCGIALFLGIVSAGCGNSDSCTVTGTVKFDGTPVETGRILFRATDGDKRAYSSEITNGKYAVKCERGKHHVEITASRIIPGKYNTINGERDPVGVMYIPPKYNRNSKLAFEATGGNQQKDFNLTSK